MNPLQHFGIKSKFIRSDTKSYNLEMFKAHCPHCNKETRQATDVEGVTLCSECQEYTKPIPTHLKNLY